MIGTKFDNEKPRYELMDAHFMDEVAMVLSHGAKKYADNNWQQVRPWTRYLGALLRHAFAIMRGQLYDEESGLSHAAHLGCNAMFIHYFIRKGLTKNELSTTEPNAECKDSHDRRDERRDGVWAGLCSTKPVDHEGHVFF